MTTQPRGDHQVTTNFQVVTLARLCDPATAGRPGPGRNHNRLGNMIRPPVFSRDLQLGAPEAATISVSQLPGRGRSLFAINRAIFQELSRWRFRMCTDLPLSFVGSPPALGTAVSV